MATDFKWFFALTADERAALWRDPYGDCNGDLAVKLARATNGEPGVAGAVPTSPNEPVHWKLSPEVATQLSAIRRELDAWWKTVPDDDKAYIIENRAGELESRYGPLIRKASSDPHVYVPVTVSDNRTGRFRLPSMVRAYVDMMAS